MDCADLGPCRGRVWASRAAAAKARALSPVHSQVLAGEEEGEGLPEQHSERRGRGRGDRERTWPLPGDPRVLVRRLKDWNSRIKFLWKDSL